MSENACPHMCVYKITQAYYRREYNLCFKQNVSGSSRQLGTVSDTPSMALTVDDIPYLMLNAAPGARWDLDGHASQCTQPSGLAEILTPRPMLVAVCSS